MTNQIHPTAVIEETVTLGDNNIIGPYCVLTGNIKLGNNNILKTHVAIDGDTTIGDGNMFFPFSCIGQIPQDKKYHGENSQLIIGNNNVFREYTTVNPGTENGGMFTKIGDNNLFMANCHIAHDCNLGSNIVIANSVALAGHVTIEDFVTIGGLSGIQQFVRIGKYAMIGGMSGVQKDVIPFGIVMGERAFLNGLNIIGLKRRGFTKEDINELRNAYDKIFSPENNITFEKKLKRAEEESKSNESVNYLIEFLKTDATKPICQPKSA
jgi:UDP-N-acetylglucosamine acyltransferase